MSDENLPPEDENILTKWYYVALLDLTTCQDFQLDI